MTEVVADLLGRQAPLQKVPGAGVAQDVRAAVWGQNTEAAHAGSDHGVKGLRGHRSERSEDLEEHFAKGASWPYLSEIAEDGVADHGYQRIDLRTPLLRAAHGEAIVLPVDVLETK